MKRLKFVSLFEDTLPFWVARKWAQSVWILLNLFAMILVFFNIFKKKLFLLIISFNLILINFFTK